MTRRPEDRPYFFDEGLCFTCTGCGQCCTGAHGTIYMTPAEVDAIAEKLALTRAVFLRRHCYPFRDSHSLKERANGDCHMLKDGRCTVYDVRPTQCRTYPFWTEILRSEKCWEAEKKRCPGIGQGERHSREKILAELARG